MKKEEWSFSQRSYPPKICASRYCENSFTPHDIRQLYCCTQCGQNERNDRKKDKGSIRAVGPDLIKEEDEKGVSLDLKQLRLQYHIRLEKIRCAMKEKRRTFISMKELKINGIDVSYALFYEKTPDGRRTYYFMGHLLVEEASGSDSYEIENLQSLFYI